MKICKKCGAHNSDERNFCVDCAEALPAPVSENEAAEVKSKINKKMNALDNEADGFNVRIFDKVVGIIACTVILAEIMLVLYGIYNVKVESVSQAVVDSLIYGVLAAVFSFFPRLYWFWFKLPLIFFVKDWGGLEPSAFFIVLRKITPVILLIIVLIINYAMLF